MPHYKNMRIQQSVHVLYFLGLVFQKVMWEGKQNKRGDFVLKDNKKCIFLQEKVTTAYHDGTTVLKLRFLPALQWVTVTASSRAGGAALTSAITR